MFAAEEEAVEEEFEEAEPEEEPLVAEEPYREELIEELFSERMFDTVPPQHPGRGMFSLGEADKPLNLTWDQPEVWFENAEELQRKVVGEEAA